MVRACVDTNIWVSGVLFSGPPSLVVRAALNGKFELVVSSLILEEIDRVLSGKFQLSRTNTRKLLRRIREIAEIVEPRGEIRVIQGHTADNLVLETAVQGKARFLVSGDRQHLLPLGSYKMVKVVDARSFLEILKS